MYNEPSGNEDVLLSILHSEYTYEFSKTTKIDNKLNIALTLCGVIFAYFTNAIKISQYGFTTTADTVLSTLSIVFLSISLFLLIYSILIVLKVIKPQKYEKLDCNTLLKFYHHNIKLCKSDCLEYEGVQKGIECILELNCLNELEKNNLTHTDAFRTYLFRLLTNIINNNRSINNKKMNTLIKIFRTIPLSLLAAFISQIITQIIYL